MKTTTKRVLRIAVAAIALTTVSAASADVGPGMGMHNGMMGQPGMMRHGMMGQPGMMRHGMMGRPGMMQHGMMGQPGMMGMRGGMLADPRAMADQQLSTLKTDLEITPEQESAWEDFSNALKGRAGLMESHRKMMMENDEMPSFEQRAAMMQSGSAQMQRVAEVAQALYAALTPEQQAKAGQVLGGHFH